MKNQCGLDRVEITKVAQSLLGTCSSIEQALARLDLEDAVTDMEALEEFIGDTAERCKGCDWWHEPGELVCEENEELTGYCEDCRKGF